MSSVGAKAGKERERQVQEKVQALLSGMLREEDNKYCVDCDSKGPRWASWNLGIFLCIRCAGIHRNLGVHISKVKSVNLDSWTPQQVASMQMMGNSRARSIYEANLPEDFKRPVTDSAVESFIRQKYEKKKFAAKDWTPSKPPDFPVGWDEAAQAEHPAKNKPEVANSKKIILPTPPSIGASPKVEKPVVKPGPAPVTSVASKVSPVSVPVVGPTEDLLGLSFPPTTSQTQPAIVPVPAAPAANIAAAPVSTAAPAANSTTTNSAAADLLGLNDFSDFVSAQPQQPPSHSASLDFSTFQSPASTTSAETPTVGGKMSTDSIMALFGNKAAPQQPQQNVAFIPAVAPNPQPQMFPQSNNLFASKQQQPQASNGLVNNPFLDPLGSLNQPTPVPVGVNNMNSQFGGLNIGTNQTNNSSLGLWQ